MVCKNIVDSIHEFPTHQSDMGSSNLVEPSHHEIEARAQAKLWAHTRKNFFTYTLKDLLCLGVPLVLCILRLLSYVKCGPHVYYCNSCFQQQHSSVTIFHTAERWMVSEKTILYRVSYRGRRNLPPPPPPRSRFPPPPKILEVID